jgi:hypothetical protein
MRPIFLDYIVLLFAFTCVVLLASRLSFFGDLF